MNPDEDVVTAADLEEARARWADPKHQPSAPELFSEPVYGNGVRGDVPLRKSGTQTFCGGPGSGRPGPCPSGRADQPTGGTDTAAPDEAAQSQADAMNNAPDDYRAADVEDVNGQLAAEGSDSQIVPDGQGGFEAMTNADAEAQHGQGWAAYDDPETGYPAAGPSGYEGDLWQAYAEDPDALERVSEAMNQRLDRVTPEEIDHANEMLDSAGGDFRLGVDGQGRTLLYGVDDLDQDYPDGFMVTKNPSTGRLEMHGAGE